MILDVDVSKPISEEDLLRRQEQSLRDRARDARRRRSAEADEAARARAGKVRAAAQRHHKCATCERTIRIEFKFCRRCAGVRRRPDVDLLEVRVPGSFESRFR